MASRYSEKQQVAPSPPIGPTTTAGLAAMIVGVIVAVLSLFDVVPTDEDVQAIGVIVGAILFVVPYVTMAISRTKQARTLAEVASVERRQAASLKSQEKATAPVVVAPESATDADVRALAELTGGVVVPAGSDVTATGATSVVRLDNHSGDAPNLTMDRAAVARAVAGHGAGRRSTDTSEHDTTPREAAEFEGFADREPLGAPNDKSQEIPGGGPRPEDVGGDGHDTERIA